MPLEPIGPAGGRAVARLARVVEAALADADLSLPQYRLLALLADGSSAATALAQRLAVSRPSVTALVDGLVHRGLVERRADPADRRRVDHVLTPDGREALAAGDEAVERRLRAVAEQLAPGDAATAVAGLARWGEALDAARERKVTGR